MSTPVIAIKTLTVDTGLIGMSRLQKTFDMERHAARMAPDSPFSSRRTKSHLL